MKPDHRARYRERARVNSLKWAMGEPRHNHIDGECCPDFSCCYPDLFIKEPAERWAVHHARYGRKQ